MSKLKKGLAKTVLELLIDLGTTNYYELSLHTGKSRDQIARAIKYLRHEGYVIRSIVKGGHYSADISFISYGANLPQQK